MAQLITNNRSVSPCSSSSTPTPNPHSYHEERLKGQPENVKPLGHGVLQSHAERADVSNGAPTKPTSVSPSKSPSQLQKFKSPRRDRGKSISLSAAPCQPVPSATELDLVSGTAKDSGVLGASLRTPSPSLQRASLILPRSPISPHRAKPRRGITEELKPCSLNLNSEGSVSDNLDESSRSSYHQVCNAPAHADLGIHCHPTPEDEAEVSTQGSSTNRRVEFPQGIVETETDSAAGSALTETGSSAPEDSVSECSNSDVEIYLEAHGLDDSAMRMNCVGHGPFTESSKQDLTGPSVVSPAFQTGSIEAPSIAAVEIKTQMTSVVHGKRQGDEPADNEGWVTSQDTVTENPPHEDFRTHGTSFQTEGDAPLAAQHGGSVRLSAGDQVIGSHATIPVHSNKRPCAQADGSQGQVSKSLRPVSELRPTSADFKPRMGIEPKTPLVEFKPTGIELKPPQISFVANQPASDHAFRPANGNLPAKILTSRGALDTSHPFQSNRAISDHEYPSQLNSGIRPDDTLYLESLQPHVLRSGNEQGSYGRVFDDRSEPAEDLQQEQSVDDPHKTPNVYINGLPPHFPEDQLFALAAPFGEVKSVRTFTRHVRDSESGYGFVLFETVEAAERCILALRKYRNLHPTFSKQVHKIPGTIYAQSFANDASGSMNSLSSWDSKKDDTDSFKRRMESLHDPTSTNLYIEGLPLSIDEPTLAALVSPHRISSSRFFQTRLSHPPRIIAFVRLETRAGAEEIIERLHGRMVRGWNDTGGRISVRFADTAEQRELRRSERVVKEGDTTAPRLTIAQAALLNLHGQELRQAAKAGTFPVIGERRRQNIIDCSYSDFSSNGIQLPNPQMSRPIFEVDYSLAPGRRPPSQHIQSPVGIVSQGQSQQCGRLVPPQVDPPMALLLDGFHSSGNTFRGASPNSYDACAQQYPIATPSQQHIPDQYHSRTTTHARMGYTATEEFIMRAHMESRRRPVPLDLAIHARNRKDCEVEATSANIATGVRGYRTRAAAITLDRKGQPNVLSEIEPVSLMNEDEFHAAAARASGEKSHAQNDGEQDPDITIRGTTREHGLRNTNSQGIRSGPRPFHTPVLSSQSQFGSANLNEQHHHQHVRCTTFPYRPTPSQHQRHQQHSSMSIPNTSQRTPQHASTAVMSQNNLLHDKHGYQDTLEKHAVTREASNKLRPKLQHTSNPMLHQNSYDLDNQPSPSLVSPTLTYSSHTPSTLSPATPFFGSFGSQNEGFDRGSLDCKKLKGAGQ